MPYRIGYLEDEGIVTIENTGNVTYKEFMEQSREALELARKKNTQLCLSDCTHLVVQAYTIEVFDFFPAIYEKIGMSRTSKLAVLMSKDAVTARDMEFFETVCLNRGWLIRIFKDKGTAIEWLRGQPGT
jgi:hypothetical protein